MPTKSFGRTLALIAGTIADAIRPDSVKRPAAPAAAKTEPVVYLADNSRLQRNAHKQRNEVEALCERHGLKAEWPSEHFFFPTGLTVAARTTIGPPIDDPRPIRALRNAWTKILECDAVIAEVTPFRGPHLSALVAFESGIAVAAGIPVFAWTTSKWRSIPGRPPNFKQLAEDRIWCGDHVEPDGNWRSKDDGTLVESFDLVDHAQIAGNFTSLSDSREHAISACAEFLKKQGN